MARQSAATQAGNAYLRFQITIPETVTAPPSCALASAQQELVACVVEGNCAVVLHYVGSEQPVDSDQAAGRRNLPGRKVRTGEGPASAFVEGDSRVSTGGLDLFRVTRR